MPGSTSTSFVAKPVKAQEKLCHSNLTPSKPRRKLGRSRQLMKCRATKKIPAVLCEELGIGRRLFSSWCRETFDVDQGYLGLQI